jgi:hypothetical protein
MSHFIVKLVQINIPSVEVKERIIRVFLNGIIIVFLSFFQFADVIESQTTVVIVETMRFNLDGFSKFIESFFPVFLLEIGKP